MKIFSMLLVGILITLSVKVYADPPLPTPIGRVVWIKGNSFKAIMPNKEERLLQKQSVINLHDLLITDGDTSAEVVFTDNTLMTFQPETKFSIDDYAYPVKKKSSVGKFFMNLIEGGFRTITGLIAKNNPIDYKIQTPVATIGVRGTDYAVYIKDGQLFVAYYAGAPCVTANKNPAVVCLGKDAQYARVTNADSTPEILVDRPDGFNPQLDITNAKIGLFSQPGTGGPITSFCIQ